MNNPCPSRLAGTLCLAIIATLSLRGADLSSSAKGGDEIPPGPLVAAKAPAPSKWTVDITYGDAAQTAAATTRLKEMAEQDSALAKMMANPHFAAAINPQRPLRIVVEKTDTIRHETRELEQNQRLNLWIVDGVLVEKNGSSAQPVAKSVGETEGDFAEFGWITRETFAGTSTENGQKVLLFKSEINPVLIDHPEFAAIGVAPGTTPVTATIDAETRLPLSLVCGTETRRYTFLPLPAGPPALPEAFAAAVREFKVKLQPPVFAAP